VTTSPVRGWPRVSLASQSLSSTAASEEAIVGPSKYAGEGKRVGARSRAGQGGCCGGV
jgi:hypothetical protein